MAYAKDSKADTAIHMLGMRFDLAVVWVNAGNHVVDVRRARPWTPVIVPRSPASYVLETGVQWRQKFKIGDVVRFEEAPA